MLTGADEESDLIAELKRMRELIGWVEGCLKRVDWEDGRHGAYGKGEMTRQREVDREKAEGIIGLR